MNEARAVMDRDKPKGPMAYSLHSLAWDYCEGQDGVDLATGSFRKRPDLKKRLDVPDHGLLEKVRHLQERIDADMSEMRREKSESEDLAAVDALVMERDALLRERKDLEKLLVDAGKRLLEAAQTVKEAEQEAAATKTLSSDVEKLCKLTSLLSEENSNLRVRIATDRAAMEDLISKKEIAETETENLRKEADTLKQSVLIMQAAAARMKEDNQKLENLLQKSSEESLRYQNQTKDLHFRVESLEEMISEMQAQLSERLSRDPQRDPTLREALLEGFSCIHKRKASTVAEILTKTDTQTTEWREKVEGLEAALLEAKDLAHASDLTKAWQLLSELKSEKMQAEKKPTAAAAASYAIPATAVSSVLAAVCIIACVKAYQPGMPAR